MKFQRGSVIDALDGVACILLPSFCTYQHPPRGPFQSCAYRHTHTHTHTHTCTHTCRCLDAHLCSSSPQHPHPAPKHLALPAAQPRHAPATQTTAQVAAAAATAAATAGLVTAQQSASSRRRWALPALPPSASVSPVTASVFSPTTSEGCSRG